MKQEIFEFQNHCIMDKMILPDNDDWIFELKEKKEQNQKLLALLTKQKETAMLTVLLLKIKYCE